MRGGGGEYLLHTAYILHRDGVIYDSIAGWNMDASPYYPDTDYAVDLEVR